jgi:hypothetical protein
VNQAGNPSSEPFEIRRGRLMRSFVMGASALLVAEYLASVLYFLKPWHALTLGWVQPWAKHFA